MKRLVFALLTASLAVLSAGCATTKDEDVSTMPWNRPASWEGQGALGGMRPPGSN
jgi:hypothetical protein